jgi:fructose/tagatose bisphosphate aldolase
MTFVPVHELLAVCVRQPWALGAYDTFNLEMTQGIVDAAVAERSPLLIMMLPGFMAQADWPGVIATIAAEAARTGHSPGAARRIGHARRGYSAGDHGGGGQD